MKFLANENIPQAAIEKLRNAGFDVVSVSENFPSVKDEAVILFASMENRIIITFDRDYGELIFKHNLKHSAGVIYLRIQNYQPAEPAEILLNLFKTDLNFEGFFTVISETNIRQRKL
jgi:predicted nuclease of predicted toxin-antitoxin system